MPSQIGVRTAPSTPTRHSTVQPALPDRGKPIEMCPESARMPSNCGCLREGVCMRVCVRVCGGWDTWRL